MPKPVGQDSKRPAAQLAREALAFIRRLYQIGETAKGKPPETRLRCRQLDSQAVLDEFDTWRKQHPGRAGTIGGSPGKASTCLGNQWGTLSRFVGDGRLQLGNNRAGRHIRPIANGRKVWLFAKSQAGAHACAAWYSVVETAKANGLVPYHYLKWLFTGLPRYQQQALGLDPLPPWDVTRGQIAGSLSIRG